MPAKTFVVLFLLWIGFNPLIAQTIHGEVLDMDDKHPLTDVNIQNAYTSFIVNSDAHGDFLIAANGGQLIEFKKQGYKTARLRVPQGYMPAYFRIIMKKGLSELSKDAIVKSNRYDYTKDSIANHELYKHELDFPKMSGMEAIASPFTALSRHNKEIWRFQDDFNEFEKEKYVDRTFNEELINKFTGLQGDSLRTFMRRYRPEYDQLKSMNDYTFFNFIKNSANHYRNSFRRSNSQ